MKDKLEKMLGMKVKEVVKLHGDASYRQYFRATLGDGKTFIIMQMPAGRSSASEEITNFTGKHNELPFINVDHFLASCGLPVPQILKYDEAEKIMVLQDLGDDLMAKFVTKNDRAAREKYYKKAIDLLVEMQRKTCHSRPPQAEESREFSEHTGSPTKSFGDDKLNCVALKRSFDATLLNWEFDHFREYLIEERGHVKMDDKDRALFESETRKITNEILNVPYCFTHRDFQSRNLIVLKDGSLALIDFQDALLGPCVYDLVALLRDSYVELEWGMVEELVRYYFQHNPPRPPLEKGGMTAFHLVTLQRKMKDAGRFVYIARVKKNPNFLQYTPATLGYVKNAFEATGEWGELFTMLKKYVVELR